MAFLAGGHANELEAAIDARRLAEHIEALALTAFSADELAAVPDDLRSTLHMLFKRRMRQVGTDLGLADCLQIRQQFDQFADNRTSQPTSLRLTAQLR